MPYPLNAPIYTPTDKFSEEEREAGVLRAKAVFDNYEAVYQGRLAMLKTLCRSFDTCVIIGNGPSLNSTDLSFLGSTPAFAANSIFLKYDELEHRPSFYVVEDHLVAEDRADVINRLESSIHFHPTYLAYCLHERRNTIFYKHLPRKSYPQGFDFSDDASLNTYTGCTVTFSSLQLAYYLGFKRIALVGVDHSYAKPPDLKVNRSYGVDVLDMESDDPNHFHPAYFGKGARWHDPQSEKMEEAYLEAKSSLDSKGIEVVNCTIGGNLEVFPRCSLQGALEGANDDALFAASELLGRFLENLEHVRKY